MCLPEGAAVTSSCVVGKATGLENKTFKSISYSSLNQEKRVAGALAQHLQINIRTTALIAP
jgi:hypothetical protein